MANVEKKLVVVSDLSQRGFETLTVADKRQIVPRVSTAQGNRLSLSEDGLVVTDSLVRSFLLSPTSNVRMTHNEDHRRILYLYGNFGVLHLDFRLVNSRGNSPLFTIPTGCPTPLHLLETVVAGGQPVWWVPKERTIYCDERVARNQRIIIHMAGIFE